MSNIDEQKAIKHFDPKMQLDEIFYGLAESLNPHAKKYLGGDLFSEIDKKRCVLIRDEIYKMISLKVDPNDSMPYLAQVKGLIATILENCIEIQNRPGALSLSSSQFVKRCHLALYHEKANFLEKIVKSALLEVKVKMDVKQELRK